MKKSLEDFRGNSPEDSMTITQRRGTSMQNEVQLATYNNCTDERCG